MNEQATTILAADLPDYADQITFLTFGDEKVRVSGEIYRSSAMPGMIAVEVDLGTLYVDADADIDFI